MTAKAAIAQAFLKGEILSIKTAFKLFGVTNLPREVSRQIEKPFGVVISRVQREGKTKYGIPCSWFEYRLNPLIDGNKEGMEKMKAYVEEQSATPKATKPANTIHQINLF